MLKIPPNDVIKIALCLQLMGAFILSMSYFRITPEQLRLEGRLQLGGNSFDIKNGIISKYNAQVGFTLFLFGFILNMTFISLQRYTTFADLRGRSIFFGSLLNIIATIAVLCIIFRGSIFISKFLSKRVYFPILKERELNNFENAVKDLTEKKDNPEIVRDKQRTIDQLLSMFDIKVPDNYTYDRKIRRLREEVF